MHKPVKKYIYLNVRTKSRILKFLLVIAGLFFTGLGFIGIFIPVLPTTPFLLLAAACFIRSSDRFYQWLIRNRYLGKFIRNYREHKGITTKHKIMAISLLWLSIGYSAYIVNPLYLKILLPIIAILVTLHILKINTLK